MATEGPFPWCAPLHVGGGRQVATEDPTPWGAAPLMPELCLGTEGGGERGGGAIRFPLPPFLLLFPSLFGNPAGLRKTVKNLVKTYISHRKCFFFLRSNYNFGKKQCEHNISWGFYPVRSGVEGEKRDAPNLLLPVPISAAEEEGEERGIGQSVTRLHFLPFPPLSFVDVCL